MKRRLLILAVFLLAGAVVNVAVAWGCAAWHYVAEATRTPGTTLLEDGSTSWLVASYRSRLAHRMHSVWWPGALFAGAGVLVSPGELVRGWAHILAPDADNGGETSGARVFDGRGWPMISMWSALELEFVVGGGKRPVYPGKVTRVTRGIELAPYSQFRSGWGRPQHQYRVLPLGIIWPGFAVNTLFYAGILWLLILAFTLRRLIRQRRGLCLACGYDLRHAEHEACPECGVTA